MYCTCYNFQKLIHINSTQENRLPDYEATNSVGSCNAGQNATATCIIQHSELYFRERI
jgi:hypothetical protein